MSAHHAPDWVPARHGTGIKHDGTFATWLGLCSFTFLLLTFIAANIYLRGWNPEKFNVDFSSASANLPAITTLVLLVTGFFLVLGGNFFRQGNWKSFQATMILSTLGFAAFALMNMWMVIFTYDLGPAARTTHMGLYVLQFLLALVDVAFLIVIGFKFSERNEKALRSIVPAAMSVFIYTVVIGLTVLLVTDMISVSEFTEWCGSRFAAITK